VSVGDPVAVVLLRPRLDGVGGRGRRGAGGLRGHRAHRRLGPPSPGRPGGSTGNTNSPRQVSAQPDDEPVEDLEEGDQAKHGLAVRAKQTDGTVQGNQPESETESEETADTRDEVDRRHPLNPLILWPGGVAL
jgi:hypothetical protein